MPRNIRKFILGLLLDIRHIQDICDMATLVGYTATLLGYWATLVAVVYRISGMLSLLECLPCGPGYDSLVLLSIIFPVKAITMLEGVRYSGWK